MADDPKSDRRAIELLLVRARTADHRAVAEDADLVAQKPELDREVLVELAQCYSQLAASRPADAAPRRQYLNRALDLIGRAVAKGYTDAVVLQTDPDLDAVREAAGFRDVLATVGRPGAKD